MPLSFDTRGFAVNQSVCDYESDVQMLIN